ncbi:MAG: hypothetical protein A3G23_14015 [Bacteroidetes bacterium RIFCSPLOWO2_12_FULL_37_12]|nr:MAG: hypothetical protein A3G23_14015 [Bacteroidetes bacterium RIFCSPLOWO2_12_FULL_37_12]
MRISLNYETIFYIIAGIFYLFYSFRTAKKKREKALEQRRMDDSRRPAPVDGESQDDENPNERKTSFETILEELERKFKQEMEPEPKPVVKKEVAQKPFSAYTTLERKKVHEPMVHEKSAEPKKDVYSIEYEPRKTRERKIIASPALNKSGNELPLKKWLREKNNLKKAVVLSTLLKRYGEE